MSHPNRTPRDLGLPKPCDNLLPLAIVLTIVMMLLHPVQTWRIFKDGE